MRQAGMFFCAPKRLFIFCSKENEAIFFESCKYMNEAVFLPFHYAYGLLKVASNSLYWCFMSRSQHQPRADKEGVLFYVPCKGLVKPIIETSYPGLEP